MASLLRHIFFARHTNETSVYALKQIRACVPFAPFSVHLATPSKYLCLRGPTCKKQQTPQI